MVYEEGSWGTDITGTIYYLCHLLAGSVVYIAKAIKSHSLTVISVISA